MVLARRIARLLKRIQVVLNLEVKQHCVTLLHSSAFEMPAFAALNAPCKLQMLRAEPTVIFDLPYLETAHVAVAIEAALRASFDILGGAFSCLVADLIAFEAKFLGAFKRVVRIFSAQNAREQLPVVGAFARHVSKLLAIATLNRGVFLLVIARNLRFQLLVVIFAGELILLRVVGLFGRRFFLARSFAFLFIFLSFLEVHVTF